MKYTIIWQRQVYFENKYNVDDTPVARKVANRVLTLPLYPDLDVRDVDRICNLLLQCRFDKK